jgi:dsRNA-specific ribonuclease
MGLNFVVSLKLFLTTHLIHKKTMIINLFQSVICACYYHQQPAQALMFFKQKHLPMRRQK